MAAHWFGSDLSLLLAALRESGPAEAEYHRALSTLQRLFGAGVWSDEDVGRVLQVLAEARMTAPRSWAYCWALSLFARAVGVQLPGPTVLVARDGLEEASSNVLASTRRRALPAGGR